MKAMRLEWRGGFRFVGTDGLGAPVTIDGDGSAGASGIDLLPLSLAACLAYDVVNVMRKSRQEMTGLRAEIAAEQGAEPPRPFARIDVTFVLAGRGLKPSAAERAIALARKECPVLASLSADVAIEVGYRLEDAPAP